MAAQSVPPKVQPLEHRLGQSRGAVLSKTRECMPGGSAAVGGHERASLCSENPKKHFEPPLQQMHMDSLGVRRPRVDNFESR